MWDVVYAVAPVVLKGVGRRYWVVSVAVHLWSFEKAFGVVCHVVYRDPRLERALINVLIAVLKKPGATSLELVVLLPEEGEGSYHKEPV